MLGHVHKYNEATNIGADVVVKVLRTKADQMRIGIDVIDDVSVCRNEIRKKINAEPIVKK